MTPMSLSYVLALAVLFPECEQRAKSQKIKSEKTAVAGCFNAIVLSPCTDRRGPGIRCQLADGLR